MRPITLSKENPMKRVLTILLAVAVSVAVAIPFLTTDVQAVDYPLAAPTFVANQNGVGLLTMWRTAVDDGYSYYTIRMKEVGGDTARFSIWGMVGTTHTRLFPKAILGGAADFDTMITLLPSEDRTFVLPAPYGANAIFFTQGGVGDVYVEAW